MPYALGAFAEIGLSEGLLRLLIDEHEARSRPALERLWSYYRNPRVGGAALGGAWGPQARACAGASGRVPRGRLAQEEGLPARLTRRGDILSDDRVRAPREIVIENDIAWRVHAMVDFMLGRPVTLASRARDERKRAEIDRILAALLESSGGTALIQDMALLGGVYGHVDALLRADAIFDSGASRGSPVDASDGPTAGASVERAVEAAAMARIELIEPTRAIPVLDPGDYRRIDAMIIRSLRAENGVTEESPARRIIGALRLGRRADVGPMGRRRLVSEVVEIFSGSRRQAYIDERLVEDAPNPLGAPPVVHFQNISQPFAHDGLGEVEPLIPLQDELNTRLSDRANRVTMQSFKMYLAKGLDLPGLPGLNGLPTIGPGQLWLTDNPDASIEAFGGDADSPSETRHIEEIREAMDKASGVTPLAAGIVSGRIGNLSSANALRVTLTGLISKTARKRVTYGRGLSEIARLALRALDLAGVYRTDESDREVEVIWPRTVVEVEEARERTV